MRRCRWGWKRVLPWILLLSLAAGALMAVYVYRYEQPVYEAVYMLYAVPADGVDARSLAQNCQRLTQTSTFQQSVLSHAYSDGQCYVKVRSVTGTHMLEVIVSGPDAPVVQGLANAVGAEMCLRIPRMFGARGVREMERAALPDIAAPMHLWPKTAAAAVAVFVLLSVLACCFAPDQKPLSCFADQADAFRLGAVEDMRTDTNRFLKKCRKQNGHGTFLSHVERSVREDIRQLVLMLRAFSRDRKGYSLVFSGMRSGDEEAPMMLLLASELAQQGFRVLLMEMDGQSPKIAQLLNMKARADLYDYLKGRAVIQETIVQRPGQNLAFVDSLHPEVAVADMAATQHFSEFIQSAKEHFDFVLLHAAPRACCCDAAMLSLVADGAVLVARDQAYSLEEIEAAARELARLGKPAKGVVFTCVRSA